MSGLLPDSMREGRVGFRLYVQVVRVGGLRYGSSENEEVP